MGTSAKCASVDNLEDLQQTLIDHDNVIAMVYVSWCPF